jgi:hypothetical protein
MRTDESFQAYVANILKSIFLMPTAITVSYVRMRPQLVSDVGKVRRRATGWRASSWTGQLELDNFGKTSVR